MSKHTVLCVDDEADILELLKTNLEKDSYKVYTAPNGLEAINRLPQLKPDLVILDIMMPYKDGLDVCKFIRNHKDLKDTYVFFLTAKSEEIDELLGLEVGADDYIAKPFSPRKVLAKVKALFRRHEPDLETLDNQKQIISYEGLTINKNAYTVVIDGQEIKFLHKEFELLFYLMSRPELVFSRADLLTDVWGEDAFFVERTVDVHITKVRKKLGDYAKFIHTISGVGYKFSIK